MDQSHRLALASLDWLLELGADEAIGDAPVDRYALAAEAPARPAPAVPAARTPAMPASAAPATPAAPSDLVAVATAAAAGAADLPALAAAMEAFPCDLKPGARRFVFADGRAGAPLMVVGEAPGREEDMEGRPFVGAAGKLLDRMLAAIGIGRDDPDPSRAAYIANVLPWRPPANRAPEPAEVARWRPFLLRHVELARPRVLLILGNTPSLALLGRGGITRSRGAWAEAAGRPALPSFHPAYLLRNPAAKREAWADLLSLRARLDEVAAP